MSVKVFQTNKTGKIEFTRCELEKLLNETYREGYVDGEAQAKKDYLIWTSPMVTTTNISPINYRTSTTALDNLTCNTITTNHAINEDTVKTVAAPDNVVKVEATAALEAPEAPEAPEAIKTTINAKNVTFNMDEVNKLASALLGSDLFGSFNVNGAKKAIEETPFTKLAKELNF